MRFRYLLFYYCHYQIKVFNRIYLRFNLNTFNSDLFFNICAIPTTETSAISVQSLKFIKKYEKVNYYLKFNSNTSRLVHPFRVSNIASTVLSIAFMFLEIDYHDNYITPGGA